MKEKEKQLDLKSSSLWTYYESLAYDKVLIILSFLFFRHVCFPLSLLFMPSQVARFCLPFFEISQYEPIKIFLLFMIFVLPCVRWFYLSLEFISNFIYERSYLCKMSDPSKEHNFLDMFCFSVSLISFMKFLRRFCFICCCQILLFILFRICLSCCVSSCLFI